MSIENPSERPICPFIGLRPFETDESEIFFGRRADAERLVDLVYSDRIIVLHAPSAFGKSSLLRAGVIPILKRDGGFDVIYISEWAGNPVQAVQSRLALETQKESPTGIFSLAQARWTKTGRCTILLLDQIEECARAEQSLEGLWDELAFLAGASQPAVRIVISVREDFLGMLSDLMDRVPGLMDAHLRLGPLELGGGREAIEGPVRHVSERRGQTPCPVRVEPDLIDAVLGQTTCGRIGLDDSWGARTGVMARQSPPGKIHVEAPFLQLVMSKVWDAEVASGSDALRLRTLEQLGGAQAIVRSHLDHTMAQFTDEDQQLAADVLRFLITPSGTKIAYAPADLAHYSGREEVGIETVLEQLSDGQTRILRPLEPAEGQSSRRYEVLHDVLIEPLKEWSTRWRQENALAERGRESVYLTMERVLHDLKSPMHVMRGHLDLSRRLQDLPVAPEVRSIVSGLTQATEAMMWRLDGLTNIMRWASGGQETYRFMPTSLGRMIREVVHRFGDVFDEREIGIVLHSEIDRLPPVEVDGSQISMALTELIDNAIKYSWPRRYIRISGEEEEEHVAVRITNLGIGLPPSRSERMFRRGYRGRSDAEGKQEGPGMGLGLWMVKEIVNRHGGTIQMDCSPEPSDSRETHHAYEVTATIRLPKRAPRASRAE